MNWFTKYFWRTDKNTNNKEVLIGLVVFVVIVAAVAIAHFI